MKIYLDGKEIKSLQELEYIRYNWSGIGLTTEYSIELDYIDVKKEEMYLTREERDTDWADIDERR